MLRAVCVAERGYRMPVVVADKAVFNPNHVLTPDVFKQQLHAEVDALRSFDPSLLGKATFVPPQLYATEAVEVLREQSVDSSRVVTTVRERGFSLGSSGGVALASVWDQLKPGAPVVVLHCGDGLRGSVVLEKQ